MEIRYYKHYSSHLNRDMEFKIYGHRGKPVLFIPCQAGRFWDFEAFHMIDVWAKWIEAGFVTVYDRSWYGRVLVERVEGLTPAADWKRAYAEINDFEAQLRAPRNVVVKYWLHISQEEQLRRFRERENTPWKQYKITDEDWRNREKFPAYMEAAEEMFARTSTEDAPWHIVPAEDKKYARLEVVRIYRDTLKKALKRA